MSLSTMPTAAEPIGLGTRTFETPPDARFGAITPVFLVDRVEPCLEFWVDRLGFEARIRVVGDDGLEFVQLARDEVRLAYRTRESVGRTAPELLGGLDHLPWVILYLPVSDLDALLPRLDGVEVVVPLRENDFGVRELYVREPSGRLVALVEQG
ncbi:VOC family protein [Tautonia plasticadhaerens]|uniref:Glyoxalase-like domain protein n=1 Tax=Tautonia plasticadhaerens TaxID=2527974 RepID=A0A518H7I3_9BACT|nr:VOC family protein [Tautonia plasticadhaerens]QDV36802.1 Glyoxalase-like domain protein [Tautonia plasticadhaerens]